MQLEIWAVLVAAPCIIAWFLGEMHGAARLRRMIENESSAVFPNVTVASMSQPADRKIIPAIRERERSGREVRAPATSISKPLANEQVAAWPDRSSPMQSIDANRRRKEAFDRMPSIAELHMQAQQIRKDGKVWDDPELSDNLLKTDPISARVLQHYVGSITELARCNARLDDEARPQCPNSSPVPGDGITHSPEASPIAPDTSVCELATWRASRSGAAV